MSFGVSLSNAGCFLMPTHLYRLNSSWPLIHGVSSYPNTNHRKRVSKWGINDIDNLVFATKIKRKCKRNYIHGGWFGMQQSLAEATAIPAPSSTSNCSTTPIATVWVTGLVAWTYGPCVGPSQSSNRHERQNCLQYAPHLWNCYNVKDEDSCEFSSRLDLF